MDHWKNFLQFCKYEIDSGGPDPHLKLAVAGMMESDYLEERYWRAGCYVSPYEISMGSVLWEQWPLTEVLGRPDEFTKWIAETWSDWQIRRERRAARTPGKMARSLLSYAAWSRNASQHLEFTKYDDYWDDADKNLMFFGRYALIKVLHSLYVGGAIPVALPDIRPHGAWSPRLTLAWLYPDVPELAAGNKPKEIEVVNTYASATKDRLSQYLGREASYFEIEVLLCNYRQALDERNGRYAGWSLDMDLEHRHNIEKSFPDVKFPFYELRKQIFPEEHLGEIQGWDSPRTHLCGFRKYFWSDLEYDYNQTTDFTVPVRRNARV